MNQIKVYRLFYNKGYPRWRIALIYLQFIVVPVLATQARGFAGDGFVLLAGSADDA